jgi:amino acid adenylation domain-containing protein
VNTVLTHRASRAQQRLWFVEQLVPGEPVHNIAFDGRYPDRLDADALRAAVTDLVARHESLRTKLEVRDDELCQVVLTPPDEPPVELVDLSSAGDRAYRELCDRVSTEVFDLGVAPLLRVVHVRLSGRVDALIVVLHHAIADAISTDIFMRELTVAYDARLAGSAPTWPALDVQYADFTAWQEEQPSVHQDLEYWQDQLADLSTMDLTHGRPRARQLSQRGGRLALTVDPDTTAALREFVRGERATPFMGLLAAYAAVLARVFGTEDVAIGSTVAGRPLPQVRDVIGMFVDRVVLRLDLSGGPTFRQLVDAARQVVADAHDHGTATFDQVVDAISPEREIGVTPLAQAAINLLSRTAGGPAESRMPRPFAGSVLDTGTVAHDLVIDLVEEPTSYTGIVGYHTDVVANDTATLVRDLFTRFLREALAEPDRPLWTFPVAGTPAVPPAPTGGPALLHEVIAQWARRTPDTPALVWPSGAMTFAELDAAANRLARSLRGVGPEVPVLVAIPRSAELMVAMLGVLKAGGIYVPVDPTAPAAHLSTVIAQSGAQLALVTENAPDLPQVVVQTVDIGPGNDPGAPSAAIRPDNAAYLLFTSGSTGPPKGVLVEHRNVVSYLRGLHRLCPPAASHLTVQPPTFDSSMTGTLGALAGGGTLHIVDDDTARDPQALAAYLATHPVDFIKITPSHLSALLAGGDPDALRPNRAVILGGEAAGPALTARLLRDGWGVIVHYGPTESTIGVCARWLAPGEPAGAPLGTPMPGVGVHVLDRRLQSVPPGCRGELYVGGTQVARGYLGSASATAARFVPDPFTDRPGARLYRTGDLARRQPNGELEFCGRADRQAKIRGFRVEPGAVEAVLDAHPDVRRSAVVALGPEDNRRLVAYVTPSTLDPVRLKDFAAGVLPAHAVPSEVVTLAELPVTRHGKLDFAALPDPSDERPAAVHQEPESRVERVLLECWRHAMPDRRFGVTEQFFDVGGDSILAIHVVAEARRHGLALTLRQLFAQQTIRAIASTVEPVAPVPTTPDGPAVDFPDAGLDEASLARLLAGLDLDEEVAP